MNYVQHTRAAHERLSTRPEARPHHVSLYWALFYQWNAARFPYELPLNRAEVMTAAHIGNRGTYLSTLQDLHAWGMIVYLPSHSGGSAVRLRVTGEVVPEVGQPKPAGCTRNGTTEPAEVVPEVGQRLYQKWTDQSGEVVPEVEQPSLYGKTGSSVNGVNGAAASHQKKIAVLEGEGLSGAELLDDTAPPDGADPALTSAPKEKVAPKRKGVGQPGGSPRAAAPGRRPTLPELPFSQSPLADVSAFIQAFQGTDYELADLRHYHQLVATWRDRKTGEEPRRKDWVATAKRFMLNDAADNRLKLAPHVQRRPDGTLHQQPPAGDFFAATGFKSKYDR